MPVPLFPEVERLAACWIGYRLFSLLSLSTHQNCHQPRQTFRISHAPGSVQPGILKRLCIRGARNISMSSDERKCGVMT